MITVVGLEPSMRNFFLDYAYKHGVTMIKHPIKLFTLLFSFLFVMICVHADIPCCHEDDEFHSCEKTYVLAENIDFFENRIFIVMDKQIFQTSSIFSDLKGIYFKDFKRQGICEDRHWECSRCHFCTHDYYFYCDACKQKR